jgi:hypothetical protein
MKIFDKFQKIGKSLHEGPSDRQQNLEKFLEICETSSLLPWLDQS